MRGGMKRIHNRNVDASPNTSTNVSDFSRKEIKQFSILGKISVGFHEDKLKSRNNSLVPAKSLIVKSIVIFRSGAPV